MSALTILVRSANDPRLWRCLDSIDDSGCRVVCAVTHDADTEAELRRRGIPHVVSAPGNPAATTLAAMPLCTSELLLLVDSDCVFEPGAIARMQSLARDADIVRPTILFARTTHSTAATALARTFQYTYCGFVYEPGLLLRPRTVLPHVGGYLFDANAPFTPDGELDFRLRRSGAIGRLRVVTDPLPTLTHAPLPFARHLRSYWRYGASEARRMRLLGQDVLRTFGRGLPARYGALFSGAYPAATAPLIAICDCVYVLSIVSHYLGRDS